MFRFSPNAYELGFFVAEPLVCSCCARAREWRYRGSFYTRVSDVRLCPWCVADGSAARRFDGSFSDWLGIDGVPIEPNEPLTVDEDAAREITDRTPSYPSWQQEEWRSHCGLPCAFIGFVGVDDLPGLLSDPVFARDVDGGVGFPGDVVRSYLRRDGDLAGYLFRCVVCEAHRLHVDAS
jgi:uncharacterized protein CbrC (UPF0167 family)